LYKKQAETGTSKNKQQYALGNELHGTRHCGVAMGVELDILKVAGE